MRLIYLVAFVLLLHSTGNAQIPGLNVYASGGGFLTNQNTQFSFTMGEAVTETAPGPGLSLTQGFQQSDLYRDLMGLVRYDNAMLTVLPGVQVLLKQGAVVARQTTTDNGGNYQFKELQNGSYVLTGTSSKPWGGGNSLDAMLVAKHYVGTNPLSGIRLKAADVNASGGVNSIDALQISRRFVGLISSFPMGDWVFENHDVVVNGFSNLQDNFKGLCAGDVNGSFNPSGLKTEPALLLTENGILEAPKGVEVTVPLRVTEDVNIGALSLVINYPENLVNILSVSTLDGDHSLIYHARNNELRISLYTLNPIELKAGETILNIKLICKWNVSSTGNSLHFTAGNESEMNDFSGNIFFGKSLEIPILVNEIAPFYLEQNQPNPVSDFTAIRFTLPVDGRVQLQLCNLLGQEIKVLSDESHTAGTHTITVDCSAIPAGTYLYVLHYTRDGQVSIANRRMVVVH